jgi:hypothetical protein
MEDRLDWEMRGSERQVPSDSLAFNTHGWWRSAVCAERH